MVTYVYGVKGHSFVEVRFHSRPEGGVSQAKAGERIAYAKTKSGKELVLDQENRRRPEAPGWLIQKSV